MVRSLISDPLGYELLFLQTLIFLLIWFSKDLELKFEFLELLGSLGNV